MRDHRDAFPVMLLPQRRDAAIGPRLHRMECLATRYFDLHHNADDTPDKIDPKALAQNVAAYTVFAYLAAEADGDFGSVVKAAAPAAAESGQPGKPGPTTK